MSALEQALGGPATTIAAAKEGPHAARAPTWFHAQPGRGYSPPTGLVGFGFQPFAVRVTRALAGKPPDSPPVISQLAAKRDLHAGRDTSRRSIRPRR
jgi:hypothetical protein